MLGNRSKKDRSAPQQAFDQGAVPLRTFLLRFARERDIQLFLEIGHEPAPRHATDLTLKILIPAYIPVGIESRLSNRRGAVPALSGDRHRGCLRDALHRHDAVAARHGLGALQDSAFCLSRRLEPGHRLVDEDLSWFVTRRRESLVRLFLQHVPNPPMD